MIPELPEFIRIGHLDYQTENWEPSNANIRERWGECDKTHLVIRVRADLHPQLRAEVLFHEILHAAYDAGNVSAKDGEERIVDSLGKQLTQVWRDNPDLVSFMEATFRPSTGEET